jgi:hypothetical protein
MGFPTLEVGYTSTTTGRRDHEVHKGHVVALGGEFTVFITNIISINSAKFLTDQINKTYNATN